MRILFATGIYPPDAGGPATYTRAVARALSGEHDVKVVAYGETDGIDQADGFPVHRIGRKRNVLLRYWKYMQAVRVQSSNVDAVFLQGPVSEGFPGTLGALLAGKPVVMKVVGDYAWESYQQSATAPELLDAFLTYRHQGLAGWIERIERFTAKRAKRVIVPSKYLATVAATWGVPHKRVRVVYNAAEPLPQGSAREDARARFNVSEKRVFLTAVRAVPWKGVDFLIRLLPDLSPDVLFVVAGDGPMLKQWIALARERQVEDRVRFVGRLDRASLAEWYRAADLFVLPSGYEGFPHVVPEAASLGLPCFVSDRGGNPETQELLGASLVRVLPYGDAGAWTSALFGPWPERTSPVVPESLKFETMMANTVKVLREVV